MKKVWRTKEGKEIPYNELSDKHLLNIIKFVERKAKEGIVVYSGHDDAWGIDACRRVIKGKEVFAMYNYNELVEEAKIRQLK